MTDVALLMFGTDLVSCKYADRLEREPDGFIAANSDQPLNHFRPDARVIRDDEMLKKIIDNREVRVLYPEYRRDDFERWCQGTQVLPASIQVQPLPAPGDYLIDFFRFGGTPESAMLACKGYEDEQPIQHVLSSFNDNQGKPIPVTTSAGDRQVRLFDQISKIVGRPIHVLDFGGSAGGHYFGLTLEQREQVASWTIVETPTLVEQLSRPNKPSNLFFTDSLSNVTTKPDFVLASSSLQYVDSFDAILDSLIALRARFFCIDRTPMTDSNDELIYLQRVFRNTNQWRYETSYPCYIHPQSRYLTKIQQAYRVMIDHTLTDEAVVKDDAVYHHHFIVGQLSS